MARFTARIAESSEEVEVVGKKEQKRQAKAAARAAKAVADAKVQPADGEAPPQADDPMSRCAHLCQDQRWREALVLCRQITRKAAEGGNPDAAMALGGAMKKIDFSLRRQMAAAIIVTVRDFLNKEYLLDVGK
ncbi:MAG: hypothetical protein JXR77_14410 [Lentisphaeria bacterium]|nr:hypothetical protein [Lentisphaeria bacterium]